VFVLTPNPAYGTRAPTGTGVPLFKFCSEMLILTSDWANYYCRLGILFSELNIHPYALASPCTPSAPLQTGFLCLLADSLRFADPPSGFPVTERTHCCLQKLTITACFLRSMCPALSPASPFRPPSHTYSTPCTTDTAATLDSLVGPPASVTSLRSLP
jgi:hypothetical protein